MWGGYASECMCGMGMQGVYVCGGYVNECMCGVCMQVIVCMGWVCE